MSGSATTKEAWRCDSNCGANVISVVPKHIGDPPTVVDSGSLTEVVADFQLATSHDAEWSQSGSKRRSLQSNAYEALLEVIATADHNPEKETVKRRSVLIEQQIKLRHRFFPMAVVALPLVELLAVHLSPRDQEDSNCPIVLFTVFSETFLICLALVSCAAECWPNFGRSLGTYGQVIIRSILVWTACFLISLSSPARRCHFLGYRRDGDYDPEVCNEGITSQWIALLLGLVAISQQLPFIVFVPLSQLAALQHLVISAFLPCPGTPKFDWNPALLSALQLHILAGQFAVALWRFNAESECAAVMHQFVDNIRVKQHEHTSVASTATAGWLVQLMHEMATEDLHCRQLVANLQKVLPTLEITLDLTSLLTQVADIVSKWVKLLHGKADVLRAIGDSNTNTKKAKNHVTTIRSVACGVGGAASSGIEAFVNQSFLPTEEQQDEESTQDILLSDDEEVKSDTSCAEVPRVGEVHGNGEANDGFHCPVCYRSWPHNQAPVSGFCDCCSEKVQLKAGLRKASLTEKTSVEFEDPLPEIHKQSSTRDGPERREARLGTEPARREKYNIGEWSMNALEIEELEAIAAQIIGFELLMPYKCFQRKRLCSFLKALHEGYDRDNPYHTQVHAGDVCNSIYFVTHTIGLFQDLNDTKRVALLLAALGHDLGHFGRNNQFLIKNRHNLATTYNDRSVLESFHCATLFRLLEPDRNIGLEHCRPSGLLSQLSSDTNTKARQFIIALILATDTQHHLEDLASFKAKLDTLEATGDFDCLHAEKDQQDILCFLFRAADIGHSAKPWHIHEAWSIRVSEEFHRQGDEELTLGIPISPLCDRRGFVMSTSQMGFLRFICLPTWTAITRFEAIWRASVELAAINTACEHDNEDEKNNAPNYLPNHVTRDNSRDSVRKYSWDTRVAAQKKIKKEDLKKLIDRVEHDRSRGLGGKKSVAEDCLAQCEANFKEWEQQSKAIEMEIAKAPSTKTSD